MISFRPVNGYGRSSKCGSEVVRLTIARHSPIRAPKGYAGASKGPGRPGSRLPARKTTAKKAVWCAAGVASCSGEPGEDVHGGPMHGVRTRATPGPAGNNLAMGPENPTAFCSAVLLE